MSLCALLLTDPLVRRVIRESPNLSGKCRIARGTFSCVYDAGPDRVLKLTIDKAAYVYQTDQQSPQGPHLPKLFHDLGVIGETSRKEPIFLYEVERLTPLLPGSDYRLALLRAMRRLTDHDTGRRLPTKGDFGGLESTMFPLINQFLDDFDDGAAEVDAQVGSNYMTRADGSLVASDPVYDRRLLTRHAKRYLGIAG